ncbi:MAG: hypothetical protein ACPG8V_04910 [Alphaproteobacteria bacterium]
MKSKLIKTSFASGELMPELYGRSDLQTYQNGASELTNVNVLTTGGVIRRSGSLLVGLVPNGAKLFGFSVSENDYMAVFYDKKVDVYNGLNKVSTLDTPYGLADLKDLFLQHNNNNLWICSGKYPIKRIVFENNTFAINEPSFSGLPNNVFNANDGYAKTVGFYQGRVILAGTNKYPNRIWFSKSGSMDDFSLGKALDDEGIDINLLSSGNDFITGIYCGANLIIFTNAGEWIIKGEPITPNDIVASKYSSIGSPRDRRIDIVGTEKKVLFVNALNNNIYGFEQDKSISLSFSSEAMVSLSRHLSKNITAMAYSEKHHRLFCVKEDGKMMVVNFDYTEGVFAISKYETDGLYKAVSVNKDYIYTVVLRNNKYYIEVFSKTVLMDCCVVKQSQTKKYKFTGFNQHNNKTLMVVADDILRSNHEIKNNELTLTDSAKKVVVGYKYPHTIKSLPLNNDYAGSKVRIRKITVKLNKTASLRIDFGKGFNLMPFKKFGTGIMGKPIELYSGDKTINVLGWKTYNNDHLWTVSDDSPLPMTILSIKTDISIN